MKHRILFITEALSAPFDEGIKNVALSLHTQLKLKREVLSVTNEGNETTGLEVSQLYLNKLFLSNLLRRMIRDYYPQVILYLPNASITFASFMRAKILKLMNRRSRVVILGIQHREYSRFQDIIITALLRPDLLLLLGRADEEFFLRRNFKLKVLPPAVDSQRFNVVSVHEKERIRSKYNIPHKNTVVLHVGHIKVNRNIECLLEVGQQIPNLTVVIVGSTSIGIEYDLKEKLSKAGVIILDEAIPDISSIYKMSDIYIFPVIKNQEAIEMPLSVLEAMSCNLPVITTRFGALAEYFQEDEGFKFFSRNGDLEELIRQMTGRKIDNRSKMREFTWSRFADTVIFFCEDGT